MNSRRSRVCRLMLAVVAVGTVTSCSTGPADFVREGEKFLQSDDMARAAGYRLLGARCESPTSLVIGTVYFCTATDERGYSWRFELEITGPRELTVQDVSPAPGTTWNN